MASPCRFCLERTQTKENPFIQPCNCKGSVKNVHLLCIAKWRNITENPEAKYKCQLCNVTFNFPTRWLRQPIVYNSPIWYILQKQYFFIIIAQSLHIQLVNILLDNTYLEEYNTTISKRIFQGLLVGTSAIYLSYYVNLVSHISEKTIYWYYACVKNKKMPLLLAILGLSFIGTFLHLVPFSYVYIVFLPHIIHCHIQIVDEMNNDCEILKLT